MTTSKRDRAAAALDATHAIGERGPNTMMARARLAAALDGQGRIQDADLTWLETISRLTRAAPGAAIGLRRDE